MIVRLLVVLFLMGTLALIGCTTKGRVQEEEPAPEALEVPVEDLSESYGAEAPEGVSGSEYGAAPGQDEAAQGYNPFEDPTNLLSRTTVYFDFDSTVVGNEYHDILNAHSLYLADHPEVSITLTGHADERGTREYNIGLGERRAQSVARFLVLQGAAEDQLHIISYGEEQPVAFGHDEESWSLNRRVELQYGEQ